MVEGRQRVLVLSFTDLARDPRVNRQIRFLAERFAVTAAGRADPEVEGVAFVRLAPTAKPLARRALGALRLVARRYESYYWKRSDVLDCLHRLHEVRADLLVANDLETLPAALRLAAGGRVLFDAHEYAPREFEEQWSFRVVDRPFREALCRRYIPQVDGMMTVCEGIARQYRQDTGVEPVVVWNAPEFEPLEPAPAVEEPEKIRLVHHGGAQRSRQIERMIRMMRHLDRRFELSLMLVGSDRAYMDFLRAEAGGDPRIRFLDPVPMRTLSRELNRFDVGVYILEPTSFNNLHSLPNKFFEFVQARLAVAIGPSPEMSRLVEQYGFGRVADDFAPESLARQLSTLTRAEIERLKQRAHEAARPLSAESSRAAVLEMAGRVLGGPARVAQVGGGS